MNYFKTNDVLRQLIKANNVRIKNYQTAIVLGRITEFEELFVAQQITSINCISTLSNIKKQKNFLDIIEPISNYNLFKFILFLKLTFGFKRKITVLKACKKNEDCILDIYQKTLEKYDLFDISIEIIKTINLQQMELKKNHDSIIDLIDQYCNK